MHIVKNLKQLLEMEKFDFSKKTKLVRHTKQGNILVSDLYKQGKLIDYQSVQSSDKFKDCQYLISFIKTEGTKAIFVGVYEIINKTTVENIRESRTLPDLGIQGFYKDTDYFYENKETDILSSYKDRLVIDWGVATKAWVQNLFDKEVVEILLNGYFNNSPGFDVKNNQKSYKLPNTSLEQKDDLINIDDLEKGLDDIRETEKEAIVKIRIGQSKIRQELLSKECKCKMCGVDNEKLLIASHIKPWSKSDSSEKYDLDNLFLLCPNHDALFDKRYISFDDDGKIIISESISEFTKLFMNIHDDMKIKINEKNKIYLKWHRDNMNK